MGRAILILIILILLVIAGIFFVKNYYYPNIEPLPPQKYSIVEKKDGPIIAPQPFPDIPECPGCKG